MNCDDLLPLLGRYLHRELDGPTREAVESHLNVCDTCRTSVEAERQLDADLGRAMRPLREAGARVAQRVATQWALIPTPQIAPAAPSKLAPDRFGAWKFWGTVCASAAAGFIVALLCLPLLRRDLPVVVDQPSQQAEPASLARLVVATGEIEVQPNAQDPWKKVTASERLHCEPGAAVRTGPGVRAELETSAGCTLRINENSELALRSAREIELRAGELWCQSSPQASMQVVSAAPSVPEPAGLTWSARCSPDSAFVTHVGQPGAIRIASASGNVDVTLAQERKQIKAGEVAHVVEGAWQVGHDRDGLLATDWMNPLIARHGLVNPELDSRVDRMLAQLGDSKMSYLYDVQIRSLGEYGVLPLLRYVASAPSRDNPTRRLAAMEILSDVSPGWAIPDLIALLADEDPQVRVLSATALERLTEQTQGVAAADWKTPRPQWPTAYAAWQEWWQTNRQRYPSPLAHSAPRTFPTPRWPKTESFPKTSTKG